MNKSIFIPSSLFENTLTTPEEVCMYIYYGLSFSEDDDQLPFSYNLIGFHLFDRMPTRREIEKIKKATTSLEDKGLITKFESVSSNIMKLHFEYYKINDSEYFTEIIKGEFLNLTKIVADCDISSFAAIDVYVTMLLNMNGSKNLEEQYRYKVCTPGKEILIQKSHCTPSIFERTVKTLEENNLISVETVMEKTRDISFNIYGRKKDSKILKKYAYDICKGTERFVINREKESSQRQMTSIYIQMINNKIPYPFYIAQSVWKFVVEYTSKNTGQTKYNLELLNRYLLDLAKDYVSGSIKISDRTIKKYKDMIPNDFDDIKEAKAYLSEKKYKNN